MGLVGSSKYCKLGYILQLCPVVGFGKYWCTARDSLEFRPPSYRWIASTILSCLFWAQILSVTQFCKRRHLFNETQTRLKFLCRDQSRDRNGASICQPRRALRGCKDHTKALLTLFFSFSSYFNLGLQNQGSPPLKLLEIPS